MNDLETILKRCEAYFEEGLYARAIAGCGAAIAAGAKSAQLYLLRAKAYAAKAREDAGLAPGSGEVYERWAENFSRGPLLQLALDDALRAVALDAANPEAYFGLGIVLMDRRDWGGALAALDKCLALDPEDNEAAYWKAVAYDEMGDTGAALAELDGLISAGEPPADAYHFRSQVRLAELDFEGALADITRALELEPEEPEFHLQRGKTLSQMSEKPEWADRIGEAVNALSEAVRLAPGMAEAYDWRAFARLQAGDDRGELADLDALIKLEPANPDAYRRRYECRTTCGDRAGAALDWLYFCKLDERAVLVPAAEALRGALISFTKFRGN